MGKDKCTLEDIQSNGEIHCRVICPIYDTTNKCCKYCTDSTTCPKVCGLVKDLRLNNKQIIHMKCIGKICPSYSDDYFYPICRETYLRICEGAKCRLPENIQEVRNDLLRKCRLFEEIIDME